ncbi:MAG: putative DNA-binding domain-containing protein [Phycisphaerae bacterium]
MAKSIKRKRTVILLNTKPAMVPVLIKSRSDLHTLQEVMLQAVSRELTPALNMKKRWMDGTPTSIIAQQFIKPNDRLSSFERLEIYNRQYWFRLLDCLYDDFAGLRAVLGEAQFHKMSRAYLAEYPSRSFQLRNLGQQLETFLTRHPQWAGSRLALALDMAKFEWAQIEAFDAQALPVLEVKDLAGRNPAELRIKLQPYISLLRLEYPLDEFAIALKKESPMHTEAAEGKRRKRASKHVPLPKRERIFLATHRFNNAVFFKRIEEPAFILLEFLHRGLTLEEAVGRALPPFFTADMARDWPGAIKNWFANWAELGWLCK